MVAYAENNGFSGFSRVVVFGLFPDQKNSATRIRDGTNRRRGETRRSASAWLFGYEFNRDSTAMNWSLRNAMLFYGLVGNKIMVMTPQKGNSKNASFRNDVPRTNKLQLPQQTPFG